jgi:hypothetical protein
MGYCGTAYEMRPTADDSHPSIDLEAHKFWDEWYELDQYVPPGTNATKCRRLSFRVNHPRALELDWYYIDIIGALSSRACSILWPFLNACCNRFQTTVNSHPYFILRSNGTHINCVIRHESILEPAPDDPNWFLGATRLRFNRDKLTNPQIFTVPEQPSTLLVTESIRQMVEEAHLNGFEFIDCESLRGYF